MKKIKFLIAAMVLAFTFQAQAQISQSETRYDDDRVEYIDRGDGVAHKKGKKYAKKRKVAKKEKLKAMRKVAKADGKITPKEKAVIQKEKRKLKLKSKKVAERRAEKRLSTNKLK